MKYISDSRTNQAQGLENNPWAIVSKEVRRTSFNIRKKLPVVDAQ
jgi:hypothetical protein